MGNFTVNQHRFPPADSLIAFLSPQRVSKNCLKLPNINAILDCWLTEHPEVSKLISWAAPDSSQVYWKDWPVVLKDRLHHHFGEMVAWYGNEMPINCPAPFPMPLPKTLPGDPLAGGGLKMMESTALNVYLSHIGNSLAAELTGAFSWSVTNYTPAQLRLLFEYSDLLAYHSASLTSHPGYYFQCTTSPATPGFVVSFFKKHSLIGADAVDTVGRLFGWAGSLGHFFGEPGYPHPNYPFFWGPESPPIPVSKIIEGTFYTGMLKFDPPWFSHWTAGCGGTTQFMKSVLHAMNIPVEARTALCQHQMPFFPTIDRALSHADDPYSGLAKVTPFPGWPVPSKQEYLITGAQWNQWFGLGVDYATSESNIGRRVVDLAIQYQSDGLLKLYCKDLASQASHADGKVFGALSSFYTLAELEAKQLWQKLDAKASATGFCNPALISMSATPAKGIKKIIKI